MELLKNLLQFGAHPIPHHLLMNIFSEYKRPNDKIQDLLSKKILLSLKRGTYIVSPEYSNQSPEKITVANLLRGPSYVSLDYALSQYEAIPEKVLEITSVTSKTSKIFETEVGRFTYTHLPLPYYSYGISSVKIAQNQYGLMASPEKALCDKIVCTSNLQLRSKKETLEFLIENLRIDQDWLGQLNLNTIKTWLEKAPKRKSLENLIESIQSL